MNAKIERMYKDSCGNIHLMVDVKKPYEPGCTCGVKPFGCLPDSEKMKFWEQNYKLYCVEHRKFQDVQYLIDNLHMGECEIFQSPVERRKPFVPVGMDVLESDTCEDDPPLKRYSITGHYNINILATSEEHATTIFENGDYNDNEIELDEDFEIFCDEDES